jgi:hypothetical protein
MQWRLRRPTRLGRRRWLRRPPQWWLHRSKRPIGHWRLRRPSRERLRCTAPPATMAAVPQAVAPAASPRAKVCCRHAHRSQVRSSATLKLKATASLQQNRARANTAARMHGSAATKCVRQRMSLPENNLLTVTAPAAPPLGAHVCPRHRCGCAAVIRMHWIYRAKRACAQLRHRVRARFEQHESLGREKKNEYKVRRKKKKKKKTPSGGANFERLRSNHGLVRNSFIILNCMPPLFFHRQFSPSLFRLFFLKKMPRNAAKNTLLSPAPALKSRSGAAGAVLREMWM